MLSVFSFSFFLFCLSASLSCVSFHSSLYGIRILYQLTISGQHRWALVKLAASLTLWFWAINCDSECTCWVLNCSYRIVLEQHWTLTTAAEVVPSVDTSVCEKRRWRVLRKSAATGHSECCGCGNHVIVVVVRAAERTIQSSGPAPTPLAPACNLCVDRKLFPGSP